MVKILIIVGVVLLIAGAIILALFCFYSASITSAPIDNKSSELQDLRISVLHYFKDIKTEFATQEATTTEPVAISGAVRAPILVYHSMGNFHKNDSDFVKSFDTEPAIFEKQMQYLKDNGYNVISLGQLNDYFINGKALPAKPVVLTFDDGWQTQYEYAFPILKKFHYTATFFIFNSAMGHKNFLTWDEVKELDAAGMTIGSHTYTHPYLIKITDKKTLDMQVITAKKSLEGRLGKSVDYFAYPFGQYNDLTIGEVKSAGFKMARSIHRGVYNSPQDIYTLKAILMNSDFNRFVRELERTAPDKN